MALIIQNHNGPIFEVTLNRPDKYNAINDEMLHLLRQSFLEFAANDDARIFLLRSTGRYFSAGGDLNSPLFPDLSARSPRRFRSWLRDDPNSFTPLAELIEKSDKPTVVAHHGPCLGGALELSLAFDFRLGAASAMYMLPEAKLGAVPSAGGTARLTQMVGRHWARWMVVAGQQVSAAKAEAIGLLHACHPDDAFADAVGAFCDDLLGMPTEAVSAAKVAIELSMELGADAGRQLERIMASSLVFGTEYEQCVAAAQARMKKR